MAVKIEAQVTDFVRMFVCCAFAATALTITTAAQTLYEPLIYNQPLTTDPQGTIVDAYVYPSTGDMCAKIFAAWSSLPVGVTSATIDARGFTNQNGQTQNCAFPGPIPATANGRLLLGNVTINTSVTWAVPAAVEVIGLGALSTTVKATSSGFPIITMGVGTSQFGVKIRALTVDCAAQSGCSGIFNGLAEEGSLVEDVSINNAPNVGLEVDLPTGIGSPLAANSGPYRNITIGYPGCSTPCNGATGVKISGGDLGQIVRGLDNITIAGCNNNVAILVTFASTRIANSTISCNNGVGIKIGDDSTSTATHNVQIENVYISAATGTLATGILAAKNSSNIVLNNISSSNVTTVLEDDGAKVANQNLTIAGPFLGFYMRGECNDVTLCASTTGWLPALSTSAPIVNGTTVSWEAPSGIVCGSTCQ